MIDHVTTLDHNTFPKEHRAWVKKQISIIKKREEHHTRICTTLVMAQTSNITIRHYLIDDATFAVVESYRATTDEINVFLKYVVEHDLTGYLP